MSGSFSSNYKRKGKRHEPRTRDRPRYRGRDPRARRARRIAPPLSRDITLRMLAGAATLIAEALDDLARAVDHLATAIDGDPPRSTERETIQR